jgi:D-3-phosphoglycerate dehydrogenase
MATHKILITDYAWPDLGIERRILAEIGGELVVADGSDAASLAALATEVDAIMTCWARVPEQVITAAPKCRIVARFGIGLDNIDVSCCTRRGIPVTNVPDYCLTEVAEHTLAMLLALARNVAVFHWDTKSGRYDRQAGGELRRIEGQTLGVVGLGRIGRTVASKAQALGLNVIAATRTRRDAPAAVEICKLEELLARSDFVSLHLPLSDETRHLIGADQFALMKPTAYLINTARGDLIDHRALAQALRENRLAGAALDVQSPEPPDLSQPPYDDPRVIVTPHAAFVSTESLELLRERTASQVRARLCGEVPPNIVNPEALDNL